MQSVTLPKCCRPRDSASRCQVATGHRGGIKCAWYCHCARWTMAGPDSGQCPCEGQIKRALVVPATSALAGTGHQPPQAQGSNVPEAVMACHLACVQEHGHKKCSRDTCLG